MHQRHVLPVSHDPKYAGFNPSSTVLPAGHKKTSEYRAFPVDTILDRDVGLPTRDGFVLRADVYRPADESRVIPAIIAWGPYGKSGSGFLSLDVMFRRMGIPRSMVSGYESFEAPDPAEWIQRGYAIVNVDARGAFDSEGDLRCVPSFSSVYIRLPTNDFNAPAGLGQLKDAMAMMPLRQLQSYPGVMAMSPWEGIPGSLWHSGSLLLRNRRA